ncbi:hypothetical protein K2W90_03180 [Candidatus Babeliales bacterium]|nr:hypothetical protein [Candidatus Babeliales bacterium]
MKFIKSTLLFLIALGVHDSCSASARMSAPRMGPPEQYSRPLPLPPPPRAIPTPPPGGPPAFSQPSARPASEQSFAQQLQAGAKNLKQVPVQQPAGQPHGFLRYTDSPVPATPPAGKPKGFLEYSTPNQQGGLSKLGTPQAAPAHATPTSQPVQAKQKTSMWSTTKTQAKSFGASLKRALGLGSKKSAKKTDQVSTTLVEQQLSPRSYQLKNLKNMSPDSIAQQRALTTQQIVQHPGSGRPLDPSGPQRDPSIVQKPASPPTLEQQVGISKTRQGSLVTDIQAIQAQQQKPGLSDAEQANLQKQLEQKSAAYVKEHVNMQNLQKAQQAERISKEIGAFPLPQQEIKRLDEFTQRPTGARPPQQQATTQLQPPRPESTPTVAPPPVPRDTPSKQPEPEKFIGPLQPKPTLTRLSDLPAPAPLGPKPGSATQQPQQPVASPSTQAGWRQATVSSSEQPRTAVIGTQRSASATTEALPPPPPPPAPTQQKQPEQPAQLLQQIRAGAQLKKAEPQTEPVARPQSAPPTLDPALVAGLQARRKSQRLDTQDTQKLASETQATAQPQAKAQPTSTTPPSTVASSGQVPPPPPPPSTVMQSQARSQRPVSLDAGLQQQIQAGGFQLRKTEQKPRPVSTPPTTTPNFQSTLEGALAGRRLLPTTGTTPKQPKTAEEIAAKQATKKEWKQN